MGLRLRPPSIIPLGRVFECMQRMCGVRGLVCCCCGISVYLPIYDCIVLINSCEFLLFNSCREWWMMSLICRFLLLGEMIQLCQQKDSRTEGNYCSLVFGWIPVFHSIFYNAVIEWIFPERILFNADVSCPIRFNTPKKIAILSCFTKIDRILQKRQSTSDIVTRIAILVLANGRLWLQCAKMGECWTLPHEQTWPVAATLPLLLNSRPNLHAII